MRLSLLTELSTGGIAAGTDRPFFSGHTGPRGKFGSASKKPKTTVWQPEKTGGMPKDTGWAIPKSITKNKPYGKIYFDENPSSTIGKDDHFG